MTDTMNADSDRRELIKRASSAQNVKKRYAKERRFKMYGAAAVLSAVAMLLLLLVTIIGNGYSAFFQYEVGLDIELKTERLRIGDVRDEKALSSARYRNVVRDALKTEFPEVKGRKAKRSLYGIVSSGSDLKVRDVVLADPSMIGGEHKIWVKASDDIDTLLKGQMTDIERWQPPGTAAPVGTDGDVRISVDANAFSDIVSNVKERLSILADGKEDQWRALLGIIENQRAELAQLNASGADADSIQSLQTSINQNAEQADGLEADVSDLRARAATPDSSEQLTPQLPSYLVNVNGGVVKLSEVSNDEVHGVALVPLESENASAPGTWEIVSYVTPESDRRVKDQEIAWISRLQEKGRVESRFNVSFFQTGDSREPELAGIWGAAVGSFFTLIVTLLISFPIGVLAATYLEEFAPKNRWTDLIEVNINNLAAVPSIVFGLLGLAVFLNFFGMPRSAPLVGGMVLALMTLPTIIIASRAALKSVPPSIRQAALGMGASRLQTITHHVLPLAMPGILTGTIIGMAQALGETAPLLMIGMVAFIVDVPGGFTDPATVMPVQIYLWADSPERAFVAKTSAAIMVLLAFLITMNALAVLLRKRFERRW